MILGGIILLSFVALCVVLQWLVRRMEDNTKVRGDRYINFTATTWRRAGPPVQRAWIGEVEEPWRHGRGVLVRLLPTVAVNVGRWAPSEPTEPREGVASQDEIESWEPRMRRVA